MNEPSDGDLDEMAGKVADAGFVDWNVARARRPDIARSLAGLEAIAKLAAVHREQNRAASGDDLHVSDDPGKPPVASAGFEPTFTWGFLAALELLSEGSFGEVWRAWDPALEREVALKLSPSLSPTTPVGHSLARTSDPETRIWLEEARLLASVRHPNVLTVHGAAEYGGRAGLWTELVHGETFEERLVRDGTLSCSEAARVGYDLCLALQAVHEAGLVHADIKASNVMIEEGTKGGRRRIVLMDFGASSRLKSHPTQTRRMPAGTPLAMAPELIAGEAPTVASDVYSLGVLLHRLVCGRYPIEADTFEELSAKHAAGQREHLVVGRSGVPARFARIVERALARSPADRYASAASMARALRPLAEPGRTRLRALATTAVSMAVIAPLSFIALNPRPSVERFVPLDLLPGPRSPGALVFADAMHGSAPGGKMGDRVAGVGDINGDGYADVMVSGPEYDSWRGRVELYLGNRNARFNGPAWTMVGRRNADLLGNRIAGAGDVNGDGYADVLVSDQSQRASDSLRLGAVSLYLGSSDGLSVEPVSRIEGWQPGAQFAVSGLASAGDVNGDGYDDVLIGAYNHTQDELTEGAAFLYLGGPQGLGKSPVWAEYGGVHDALLGVIFSKAGDVNGDGIDDLLVGSPSAPARGGVRFFPGSGQGPSTRPAWVIEGDQDGARFGYYVGGVGDVNGDGCTDFVVSQQRYSGRAVYEGRVLLYLGSRHGPPRRPTWTFKGAGSNALLAAAPSIPGDVNGDGRPDILVGSSQYRTGADSAQVGLVGVCLSPSDPAAKRPVWYLTSSIRGVPLGSVYYAVAGGACVGDFNGDSLDDVVVGQPQWPNDSDRRGRAMLYLGTRTSLPR